MLVSTITNDPGDDAQGEYTNFTPIEYNYDDECEEPLPTIIDPHIPGTKSQSPLKLQNRTNVEEFNRKFNANVGYFPAPSRPTVSSRKPARQDKYQKKYLLDVTGNISSNSPTRDNRTSGTAQSNDLNDLAILNGGQYELKQPQEHKMQAEQNEKDMKMLIEFQKVRKRQNLLARKFAIQMADRTKQNTPLDLISSEEDSDEFDEQLNNKMPLLRDHITTDHQGKIIKIEEPTFSKEKTQRLKVNITEEQPATQQTGMISTKSKISLKGKKKDIMEQVNELNNKLGKMDINLVDKAELEEDLTNARLLTKYNKHILALYQSKQADLERLNYKDNALIQKKKKEQEKQPQSQLRKKTASGMLQKQSTLKDEIVKKANENKQSAQNQKISSIVPSTAQNSSIQEGKQNQNNQQASIYKLFGDDVDKVLNHPTIVHPSKIFMSNLLNGMELNDGIMIKDKTSDEIIRAGSQRTLDSKKISVSDYQKLKDTQLQKSIFESRLSRKKQSQSIRFNDMNLSIKPESAMQIKEDIYIPGDESNINLFGKKSSVSFVDDKIVFKNSNFRSRRTKSVLPSIKGVNQNSIQLLTEPMSDYYTTRRNSVNQSPSPSSKQGIFKSRNQSFSVTNNEKLPLLEPQSPYLYSNIIQSARRELQEQNPQQSLFGKSPFSRKKHHGPPKHIKEQIQELMQQTDFKDIIKVSENAAEILKSVTNIDQLPQALQTKKKSTISTAFSSSEIHNQIANLHITKRLMNKSNIRDKSHSSSNVDIMLSKPEIKYENQLSYRTTALGGMSKDSSRTPIEQRNERNQ